MRRTARAAVLLLGVGTGLAACAQATLDWQGRADVRLDDYHRAFAAAAGDRFDGAATFEQFLQQAHPARVLWLGDHHQDPIVHEAQVALLRALHRSHRPFALGLEAIGEADEGPVADFRAGRIDLAALTAAMQARWPGSWLSSAEVDAPHYRTLLRTADLADAPVFALEPIPRLPLAQRDERIAANVRAAAARWPDRLLVVVVGQAHLLGAGDLIHRTGLPAVACGAVPTPALQRAAAAAPSARGIDLRRSDRGLWFFAERLPGTPR